MAKQSAGILLYRLTRDSVEVYLAHPGGPFFSKKNEGYWGVPKGLLEEDDEDEERAARREFEEETGFAAPDPAFDLGTVKLKSGKVVHVYASEWNTDDDPPAVESNTFAMEWPPRSGKSIDVPEIDEGRFFPLEDARRLINDRQEQFIDRLLDQLDAEGSGTG